MFFLLPFTTDRDFFLGQEINIHWSNLLQYQEFYIFFNWNWQIEIFVCWAAIKTLSTLFRGVYFLWFQSVIPTFSPTDSNGNHYEVLNVEFYASKVIYSSVA